ncbi:MAG: hypothetical protein AAFZ52_05730 [Bacteroidota bacterium]
MKVNVKLTVTLFFLAFVCGACSDDETAFPVPDVRQIDTPLEVLRFDRDLAALDTAAMAAGIAALDSTYTDFAGVYFKNLVPMRRGDIPPAEQPYLLQAFLTYPLIEEISQRVQDRFTDAALAEQQRQLEQALRYYKYYLPEAPRPDTLVTYFSQFELAAFLYGDGNLAVGLDFFLGPGFDYAAVDPREPIFSRYLSRSYTPEHLTAKLMRVLIEDYVPRPRAGRLVDYLAYEGKILFLLDRVLPETPDSILHEVSTAEMDWLRENEIRIYAHLQKEEQFYSTSTDLVRKLTQPAPSSPGMPPESPGRAVNYLGKRIVEDYVRNNPRVSMEQLLAMEDGQKILAGARYKPR